MFQYTETDINNIGPCSLLDLDCGVICDPNTQNFAQYAVYRPLQSPHRFKTLGAGPTRWTNHDLVFQKIRPYQCSKENTIFKFTQLLEPLMTF